MRVVEYKAWLEEEGNLPNSVSTRISDARRIEKHFGDLDEAFSQDRCERIFARLTYSKADEAAGLPNPSSINVEGNVYDTLAHFRSTLNSYVKFRESANLGDIDMADVIDHFRGSERFDRCESSWDDEKRAAFRLVASAAHEAGLDWYEMHHQTSFIRLGRKNIGGNGKVLAFFHPHNMELTFNTDRLDLGFKNLLVNNESAKQFSDAIRTQHEKIGRWEPPHPSRFGYWPDSYRDHQIENSQIDKPERDVHQSIRPTNLILYGPPGTGKTYRTALEAVTLCDGDAVYGEDEEGRAALMQRYGDLVKEKRIEFVTFHQNFGYEDFIEGLRPEPLDEGSGFSIEPHAGIFRKIAERALGPDHRRATTELGQPIDANEPQPFRGRRFFKLSLGRLHIPDEAALYSQALNEGYVYIGYADIDWSDDRYSDKAEIFREIQERGLDPNLTPQKGGVVMPDRFRNAVQVGDIVLISFGNSKMRAIGEVVGPYEYETHPVNHYHHRRKVRWLWSDPAGVPVDSFYERGFTQGTIYELDANDIDKHALDRLIAGETGADRADDPVQKELTDEPMYYQRPYVLIIDEINRANISKVFGELITLLEPDKRLGQANALTVRLPYSKREFGVPSNLHVIGTMNTADRSIALLDTALRRRFQFKEVAPEPALLDTVDGISLQQVLKTINERIEYLIDRDHRVGHAFFMGDGGKDRRAIDAIMRDKVIPLLQEYFFEDWSRIASVVGDGFLEKTVLKAPPGIQGEARDSWAVRSTFLPDAYDRLLKGSLPDEGEGAPTHDDGDE